MSFLEQVAQAAPNQYVLPRVGAMRVDVRAFLSPELFAQTDEGLCGRPRRARRRPAPSACTSCPTRTSGTSSRSAACS